MGSPDASAFQKQPKPPGPRRPVAPASVRAYVPFVPPGKSSPLDETFPESNWTRLCGRVGLTSAGMGGVCLAVSLATGGRGPAGYLVMPLMILAAVAGCAGFALSVKKSMVGWGLNGIAVLAAVVGLSFSRAVTLVRSPGATDRPTALVAVDQGLASAFPVDPTPAPTESTAQVLPPLRVAAPALVTDQMIAARADALLSAEVGFSYGPGWVAAGRSGSAAVAMSAADPAGAQLSSLRRALPMNVSMVVVAVDNSGGTRPVQIDPEFVKVTTATGATVSALAPRLVLSTATRDADLYLKKFGHPIDVPAGAKLDQAVFFFPAGVDVGRLHGITFSVNGVIMTFRGHVMTKAEKLAMPNRGVRPAATAGRGPSIPAEPSTEPPRPR